MNLADARKLVDHHMELHGLRPEWEFKFDKGRRRFGRCRQYGTHKLISLSTELTAQNTCKRVLETLLHEIAHALVGLRHSHDHVWVEKCKELGTRETRYYSMANTVKVYRAPII